LFIAPHRKGTEGPLHAASSAFQTRRQTGFPHAVEVIMWNRFMSSPYAHFVTAMALTLGLVVGLLTGHSGKSSMAKSDASAQKSPSRAVRPALASHMNSRDPVETSFDYSVAPGQPDNR